MKLEVKTEPGTKLPSYAHAGDAGMDLRAAETVTIMQGCSIKVGTGVRVAIPGGYVGLQFPRSGLGTRGLTLRNCVGVIDSGYRGEILAGLWNTTDKPWTVKRGERVCQLVVMPYAACEVVQVDELDDTERGTDGYGSTGVE